MRKRRNFSDLNPLFWKISTHKNIMIRKIKDLSGKEKFAKTRQNKKLDNLVFEFSSIMIKKDADPVSQANKAVNIKVASSKITGIIIKPGETFSFWNMVGPTTKRRGYKAGRVIEGNRLVSSIGGGLCNLSNTINNLILHSPMQITEFHKHSDALACHRT